MLDLLVEEPRYWRRPVAVIDGRLIAGGERQDAGGGTGLVAGSIKALDSSLRSE